MDESNGVESTANNSFELEPAVEEHRRARRPLLYAALATLVAVGALAFGLSGSNSSADAATVVRNALVSTVASKSVSFTLDENVTGTASINLTGSGDCDFASGDCNMNVNYGGELSTLGAAQVIFASDTMYIKLSGPAAAQLPTPWLSTPFNVSAVQQSSAVGSGSPLAGLSMLARLGDTVIDDGTVTLGGAALHEYTVTADASQAQSQAGTVLKKLPSWMSSVAAKATPGALTEQVYIDGAGRLAQIDLSTSATTSGVSESVAVKEVMTGYGLPVTVEIPASNQVTSLSSLTSGLVG